MKYFEIIDKNLAAIFQLQWKIGNMSDMFLQYSVLCGSVLPNNREHLIFLYFIFWFKGMFW